MDRATPTPPRPSNPTPNSSLPSPPSAPSFTPAPPTLPPPPKTLSRALLFQAAGAGGLAALAFLGTPLITNYYGSLPTGPATIEAAATFAPEVHANAINAANAHCSLRTRQQSASALSCR